MGNVCFTISHSRHNRGELFSPPALRLTRNGVRLQDTTGGGLVQVIAHLGGGDRMTCRISLYSATDEDSRNGILALPGVCI